MAVDITKKAPPGELFLNLSKNRFFDKEGLAGRRASACLGRSAAAHALTGARLQTGKCVFGGTCPPKTRIHYSSLRELGSHDRRESTFLTVCF